MKQDVWGAPSRQDEHRVLPFVPRCAYFLEGSEMPILRLKPPFNEFRTRVNEQEFLKLARFKMSPIFGLYVSVQDEFLQLTCLF